jgi:septum formation protein
MAGEPAIGMPWSVQGSRGAGIQRESMLEFATMAFRSLLLASNSPRRRELVGLTGWAFRVQPSEIDETHPAGEAPDDYVRRLASGKARAAGSLAQPGELILGADTTVADGPQVLGKPCDVNEAASMLRQLRGRVHIVYTAICLFDPHSGQLEETVCATRVPMRAYDDEEIERYVASDDPLDKAGAYAIQHVGFHPVTALAGCYASVMGLPLCHLQRAAARFGVHPVGDLPKACQAALHYICPVYSAILRGEDAG